MKRIKIWLKSFNLIQQFVAVVLLTIFIFTVFVFSFLRNNIDTFINNQMISYLHRYEDHYLSSETYSFNYSDTNVDSYVYSRRSNIYLNRLTEQEAIILYNINPTVQDGYSGVLTIGETNYVFSTKSFGNGEFTLVSILSNAYVEEFKTALTQSVINVAVFVCIGLFIFFLIWVATLISPLKTIRNYIDKIKFGNKDELSLKRNDEIGEVAEAIVSMNKELNRQQSIREEMVQNISHDLKTPIAIIKSYSESIKDGIYPYDTLEKSVDVILDNANRLEKKAYNLNTFNKLGYLVDSDNEVFMAPIIQKVILATEAIRNDISVETEIDNKVVFHGEEEPWRIVVENLLDNSLRYAKTLVKIRLTKNMLEVFNDGDLMSKERMEKLFKPYEKGTKGNFGLGLSIVKRVCDTYGYQVLGENMNDGVIFRVYTNKTHKKPIKKQVSK